MRLVSYGFAGVDPAFMGSARSRRPRRRCGCAGLTIDDIGLFELNEAFAVQVLALLEHFGIADDDPRVNQYGGAIAVGHPLASSGVRLMIQLARQFADHPEVRYGLTAMCVGIGQGASVIWENPTPRSRRAAMTAPTRPVTSSPTRSSRERWSATSTCPASPASSR